MLQNVENVEHVGQAGRWDTPFPPRINHSPARNRRIMVKKPDTESTVAQGAPELQEVLFPDQNCKSSRKS